MGSGNRGMGSVMVNSDSNDGGEMSGKTGGISADWQSMGVTGTGVDGRHGDGVMSGITGFEGGASYSNPAYGADVDAEQPWLNDLDPDPSGPGTGGGNQADMDEFPVDWDNGGGGVLDL